MWEAIALTVAATSGNNIGKALQKKGTHGLPQLSLSLKVLQTYALSGTWVAGFCIDIIGALLMLRAVSQAPVSVIQPVSGSGLAVLSIFSHFYLKEPMNFVDWIGVTMAAAGTIGVGIAGEEQKVSKISFLHLAFLIFLMLCLFGLLNAWLHVHKDRYRSQDIMQTEVMEEVIIGLESGVLFGLGAAVSRLGFILSDQGFPRISVPFGIIFSICCSGCGFYYQTRGLKHGRAIVVSTCGAVSSIVTGVLVGMFALGEMLPDASSARVLLFFGWSLIIIGVLLLMSSHKLIPLVRRRLRPFIRGKQNSHKSSHLQRAGSSKMWESSASTFVSMSPLPLHNQTSLNKMKA